MSGKKTRIPKSKTLKMSIVLLVIAIIVAIFAVLSILTADISTAKSRLENDFINDLYVSGWPSEKSSVFEWYNYTILNFLIKRYKGQKPSLEEEKTAFNGIAKSFEKECTQQSKPCPLFKTLLPYCMANAVYKEEFETKDPFENPAFFDSMDHWQKHFNSTEWKESDLWDIWALTNIEMLCGNFNKQFATNTINKALGVSESQNPAEKIRAKWIKTSIIKTILNIENIKEYKASEGFPSMEKMESLCETPPLEEIAKSNNVCAVSYYFRLKRFCNTKQFSQKEQELALPFLQARYSDIEKIHCQFDILQALD